MKKKTITYALIVAMVFPAAVFSEENQPENPVNLSADTTREAAPVTIPVLAAEEAVTPEVNILAEKKAEAEREEKVKQYCESLIFRILDGDFDTGEMPEANFSVNLKNENLEKLLILGDTARKYTFSLLKGARSGHIKERILREIAEGSADLDDLATETLYAVIKDKSSQVRLLTAKILGERGSSKTIARLNSLLYDAYSLRKDVNPVRLAAREAIELIKLREEAAMLPAEERAKSWIKVIKEKAAARQDYFCEKAVKEFSLLSSAQEAPAVKENLWKEVIAARDVQGKKTLVNNKIFGYLLLASAAMKDERAGPLLENAFKDVSLMNLAARGVTALSFEQAVEMLLNEPVGSERATVLFNNLKKGLTHNKTLEFTANYPEAGEGEQQKYFSLVLKKLLVKRDNGSYMEAAKIFCHGLNDYARALFYLGRYEKAAKQAGEPLGDEYPELLASCLAGEGKIKEALEMLPVMNPQPYYFNFQFLEILSLKEALLKKKTFKTGYYKANAFLELKAYVKAADMLKELLQLPEEGLETPRAALQEKADFCEEIQKSRLEEMAVQTQEDGETLKLEIFTDRKEYSVGEEIKINFIVKNTGAEPAYGANDKEGNLGFDLVVLKSGIILNRLKKDLAKQSEIATLEAGMFTIESGSALTSEIIALSPEENNQEAELTLSVSYAPSSVLFGYEKGWIEKPLISNELNIVIKK